MYFKVPFSMEKIPTQKSFGCLSLKLGSIFSGLITILYTVYALAQCLAATERRGGIPGAYNLDNIDNVLMFFFAVAQIICHCITLIITTIMVIGTLKEKANLIMPWVIWTSCQVMGSLLLMVFWTTLDTLFDHMDENWIIIYVITLVGLLIRFYMLMLVSSYYKELVDDGPERLKALLTYDTWNI